MSSRSSSVELGHRRQPVYYVRYVFVSDWSRTGFDYASADYKIIFKLNYFLIEFFARRQLLNF